MFGNRESGLTRFRNLEPGLTMFGNLECGLTRFGNGECGLTTFGNHWDLGSCLNRISWFGENRKVVELEQPFLKFAIFLLRKDLKSVEKCNIHMIHIYI